MMPIVSVDESGRTSPEYIAEVIVYAVENNVHIVAAAGDYKENKLLFPAKYSTVISVEAQSKLDGRRYLESNWGDNSTLMLPGEIMKTLTINNNDELEIAYKNGTSYATPLGSGIVALYIDKHGVVENHEKGSVPKSCLD